MSSVIPSSFARDIVVALDPPRARAPERVLLRLQSASSRRRGSDEDNSYREYMNDAALKRQQVRMAAGDARER